MKNATLPKMETRSHPGDRRAPISVSVRCGQNASPPIDLAALKSTAESMKKTLEELDGACG